MASLVEFFDILSVKGPVSWSPNTARIRLTLNYKRIPHKTTFLSFADIADNHKALNITPNTVGMPFTCPAILHQPSKSAIQDSFPIAKYLDDTFTGPEHPTIFPTGSHALITLTQNVLSTRVLPIVLKLVVAKVPGILDVRGKEYFLRTRAVRFGMPVEEYCKDPEAEWTALEKELKVFSDMLVASGGPFFMGSTVCYADFVFVGFFVWMRSVDDVGCVRLLRIGENDVFVKLMAACEPWLV